MSRFNYIVRVLLFCLLLPIAAIAPYIVYGKGLRVLSWAWEVVYWPVWLSFGFGLISALVCFVLLVMLQPAGRLCYMVSALTITAGSAAFAMSEHRHSLLVLIFLLTAVLVWCAEWIRRTLDLPYYNSKRNWWESIPKAVPGITARVSEQVNGKQSAGVRVTNFGPDGCFVFSHSEPLAFEPGFIEFEFGKKGKISSVVTPVMYTKDGKGIGLRFENLPQGDWNRDLHEYLNGLRRAGYVSG